MKRASCARREHENPTESDHVTIPIENEIVMPDDDNLNAPLLANDGCNNDEGLTLHGKKIDPDVFTSSNAQDVREEARRVLDAADAAERAHGKVFGSPRSEKKAVRESVGSLSVEERVGPVVTSAIQRAVDTLSRKGRKYYYKVKSRWRRNANEDIPSPNTEAPHANENAVSLFVALCDLRSYII